jgi:hypothetical protein
VRKRGVRITQPFGGQHVIGEVAGQHERALRPLGFQSQR